MTRTGSALKRKDTVSNPVARMISDALDAVREHWISGYQGFDFYLPRRGIFIECDQVYMAGQHDKMARGHDVIVVQGFEAARLLAKCIRGGLLSESSVPRDTAN